MPIYRLGTDSPQLDPTVWVADSAQIMGRVHLMTHSNVWFGAVLRGDNEPITVGEGSNIQDACVLHTDPGFPLTIGAGVSVGHGALLHGCTVGDGSLIGMGSMVLNGAVLGHDCLVGAGSLITSHKQFPDACLLMGRPAQVIRPLTAEEISQLRTNATRYVAKALRFAQTLQTLGTPQTPQMPQTL